MINPKSIIFVRHAESEYNLAQKLACQQNNGKDVSLKDEDPEVKFNYELLDCPLSQKGVQQCISRSSDFVNIPVGLVIASPLQRAIETAHYLFRDHPSKPKFLIEPIIREMQMSNCDLGGKLMESMKKYPYFDFSKMMRDEKVWKAPNMWSLEFCCNKEQKHSAREYVMKRCQEQNLDYNEDGPKLLIDYMRSIHPEMLESFQDTLNRIQQAKDVIKTYISQLPPNSKLVIVSHSRTLQTLDASEFDKSYQPKNGRWWENTDSIEIEL